MSKIIFTKVRDAENSCDNTNVTVETVSETLPEILQDFAGFLGACGFVLPQKDDPIVINEEDDEDDASSER